MTTDQFIVFNWLICLLLARLDIFIVLQCFLMVIPQRKNTKVQYTKQLCFDSVTVQENSMTFLRLVRDFKNFSRTLPEIQGLLKNVQTQGLSKVIISARSTLGKSR